MYRATPREWNILIVTDESAFKITSTYRSKLEVNYIRYMFCLNNYECIIICESTCLSFM